MSFTQDGQIKAPSRPTRARSGRRRGFWCPSRNAARRETSAIPASSAWPTANILMSYIYNTYPTTPYYGHILYAGSSDDGARGPIILDDRSPATASSTRSSFTASRPAGSWHCEYKAIAEHFRSCGLCGDSFFSDDQGYSGSRALNTVDMYPSTSRKATAVELKDGRILLFARSYSGHPVRAYSTIAPDMVEGRVDAGAEDAECWPCLGCGRNSQNGRSSVVWISEATAKIHPPALAALR